MELLKAPFKFDTYAQAEGRIEFEGMAVLFDVVIPDWISTIIRPGAFAKTLRERSREIVLLWQHDSWEPIGVPLQLEERSEGLWLRGRITPTQRGRDAILLLQDGVIKQLSIGFDIVKEEFEGEGRDLMRYVTEARLWEISLVTWGMAPGNRIDSVGDDEMEDRLLQRVSVTPYQALPLAALDQPFVAPEAAERVRRWSGEPPSVSPAYRRAFAWAPVQVVDPIPLQACKLPLADVVGGVLQIVPSAVFRAASHVVGGDPRLTLEPHDAEALRLTLSHYFMAMRAQFEDASILAPWEGQPQQLLQAVAHYALPDQAAVLAYALMRLGQDGDGSAPLWVETLRTLSVAADSDAASQGDVALEEAPTAETTAGAGLTVDFERQLISMELAYAEALAQSPEVHTPMGD